MTAKNKTTSMSQCTVCGFLKGGHTSLRPCTAKSGTHSFKDLESSMLATALGSTGGRPPTYETEAERLAARRATYKRANDKRRGVSAG